VKQQGATQGGKQEYDTNGDKKVIYDVTYLDRGKEGVSIPASHVVRLQGGEIRVLHIPEEIKESPFVFVKRDVDKDKGKGIIGIKKECQEIHRRSPIVSRTMAVVSKLLMTVVLLTMKAVQLKR
jgi:hypothetical protein